LELFGLMFASVTDGGRIVHCESLSISSAAGISLSRRAEDQESAMTKYRIDRVKIVPLKASPATWSFAGSTKKGTDFRYEATDGNYRSRNQWEFILRVPRNRHEHIEVRPAKTPNDSAFAGLDRRSLTFMRGTLGGYKRFRYCQMALALPEGYGTKRVVRRGEKHLLPYWLRNMGWRIKTKPTVRRTKGTDREALVILVQPDDHQYMITTFLATKAWVRKKNVLLD
jgi:hypothetical protein